MRSWRAPAAQTARYGLVGAALVIVEYAFYLALLSRLPGHAVVAHVTARVVAGLGGFVGHARFTFGCGDLRLARLGRYGALLMANTALSALLLAGLLRSLGPVAAKLASDVVAIGVGYVAGRRIVFTPAPPTGAAA